ncbi:MAG: hypothetical protein JO345_07095 [Streptosporangiaceae bacterium]|nr:hypothetical protein [Streptosporangiaceae bacterium]
MSESFAAARLPAAVPVEGTSRAEPGRLAVLDARRKLQLALGVIWLLDGVLQFQPSMFTKDFPQMLAGTADGNPGVVASPITWSAGIITHHLALANTIFAAIQVAIGLGIAYRPTARAALAGSVAWSLGVWWFGEGLGGILTGNASPVNGAPGAVILYALLAVLLWPADRDTEAPFAAGRAVGQHVARALWLVLWLSLAYFALQPAARAPHAISGMISGMASGQPVWLAWIDNHAASALAGHGLTAAIVLAVTSGVIAVAAYLPPLAARGAIVAAIVVAVMIWLAEGMGGVFTGAGTDPNSGPLLVLIAVSFWPKGA